MVFGGSLELEQASQAEVEEHPVSGSVALSCHRDFVQNVCFSSVCSFAPLHFILASTFVSAFMSELKASHCWSCIHSY